MLGPKQHEGLYDMFLKSWAIMGFDGFTICFKHDIIGEDVTIGSVIYFSMYGMWLNACVIQCTCISFITIAHHRVWLFTEFGVC